MLGINSNKLINFVLNNFIRLPLVLYLSFFIPDDQSSGGTSRGSEFSRLGGYTQERREAVG